MKQNQLKLIIGLLSILILAACSNTSAESVDPNETQAESTQATEVVNNEEAEGETDDTTPPLTYPIVDTNQGFCYDGFERIDCPAEGEAFYGQDSQYTGITPSYTDNGDGTITDNVTSLVWTQELSSYAMPWSDAAGYCESLDTGSVTDWRLPSVKELWSLRDYSQGWPWIDTDYFYLVGDGSDLAQHHSWSSDLYLIESDYQNEQVVGDPAWIVNDWTGHIKAMSGSRFVRCVSGDEYGINDFVDNSDGTVTDNATGLMWSQDDSGEAMYWEEALAYAENATVAGYDDWRLPSAKELQSIADYTATEIPVLDTSVFNLTEVTNTVFDGDEVIDTQLNYPFYWTNTSNPIEAEGEDVDGGTIYAWAFSSGYNVDMAGYDLHGAGSLIFVSKTEENSGIEDSVPVMVRLVRDGDVTETPEGDPTTVNPDRVVVFEDGDTGRGQGNGGGGQMPDFAAAAATLGVTEEALLEAIGEPGQEPDFEAAATALGVSVDALEAALMDSSGAPQSGPQDAPPEGAPEEGTPESSSDTEITFTVTDTKQEFSYDNEGNAILFPAEGEAFYGQDAQYVGVEPSYQDNGDSTVTDLVTGLLWEKTPTFDTYQHEDAVTYCENLEIGGTDDWRMPTIKELYSLADYRGELLLDGTSTPYIDTLYFDFEYPAGDRQYAGQYWSSTRYTVTPTSDEEDQMKYFGFNFADGHIKAYGTAYSFDGTPVEGVLAPGMYVRCVSGEENVYGENQFVDNGDGTVTDTATGLMWQQIDNGQTYNWEEALAYAENLELAGYDDWRLPNAKELQSIVQYGTTEIPAIDTSFFTLTDIDSYFWTSTTHGDFKYQGIYIAFGPAWSIPITSESGEYIDEHGAGAQRSDPKTGDPDEYNYNLTSENASDLYRIYNYVFVVRDVDEQPVIQESTGELPTSTNTPVEASSGDEAGATEGEAPDLAAAAATLGITEDELLAALDGTNQSPPDLEAAAATLGITEAELMDALGIGEGGTQPGGQPPTDGP